jgi:hypothetical protein
VILPGCPVLLFYIEPGSITNILKYLKLPTLEIRGKIKRLCLFHKAFHHQIAINIPDYIIWDIYRYLMMKSFVKQA